ncbi:hypothetical protein [Halorussus halobius]|uniref:hypothetical protein n=1 Tax=Halorussus halobius TaxID=1710537 RepID=UPI001B2FFCED|nr:hypothetical protein [Halorussus halobius]
MAASTRTRDARTLSGVIVGLSVLGIVLLVANIPRSPLRSGTLELFTIFALPLVISLVAYVRFAEPLVRWEVALLAVWGVLGIAATAFVGFLATMDTPGSYPGAGVELLRNIAMFVSVALGLGLPYGVAGKFRRERPRRTVVSALVAPFVLLVLFIAVTASI